MQKDVIYIDVEDDITAIIGKVKDASHKVVAIVPPKRVGAIQSAVNLKLVHRAATQAGKHLVIITNNAALTALSASAGIPIAKNLQSKPEMAEIPALDIDDGEDDVIDGGAVMKHAKSHEVAEDEAVDEIAAVDIEDGDEPVSSRPVGVKASLGAAAIAAKDRVKIPNFDSFRKKLFVGIAGIAVLAGFLVWALVFAPHASIVVTARTTNAPLNTKVTLTEDTTTDLKSGVIKSVAKTSKKDVTVAFTATGKKDVGEKAVGSVKIKTDAATILISGLTVPAGTAIQSSSGAVYYTDEVAIFPKGDAGGLSGITVGVTAAVSGTKYNGASGAASTDANGVTSVSFVTTTSGGTDKTVTVVQQSDIDAVSNTILSQSDVDAAKKALATQLGTDYIVLTGSFKQDITGVKPNPAVGAESSDGKGTLAGPATFSMVGVAKSEVGKFLDSYFAQQVDGKTDQKIYSNGLSAVSFTNVQAQDKSFSASISTNGKVGPKIDENALKEFAKGKRFGEIQAYVQQINGVDSVDVKFSPFWVTTAPGDIHKIQVEFKVNV